MSEILWNEALRVFPGGVNSPVRASVKPYPFYVSRAEGAYLYTEEGRRLIDYVLGYGPLFLGHANSFVKERVIQQLEKGWLYGTPSRAELELANHIIRSITSIEMIRFVNSGTEATMTAIRLARGFTKREKILKFIGCYHGAHDYALISPGSAAVDVKTSGIPSSVIDTVALCHFNDIECVERTLKKEDIAGVIVEPVMGNMGVILPDPEFLKSLREFTLTYNSVLIFDEVITGFRLGLGGAQDVYKLRADLTTLGKIIGGGLPIGAVGGKREIMEMLSPAGNVFNAGTFNANPLSMVAGSASLEFLEREKPYSIADKAAKEVYEELDRITVKHVINRINSMMQIFFGIDSVRNADDARKANKGVYMKLQVELLKRGIFLPPSQFETIFTSVAHDDTVINESIDVIRIAKRELE
ncbi:glutamate-1-semialdehyde-2,1-aminomutase [Sulfolobales archaeon HS-7]|nr:glutamate-1-semialdehyde-2,1-aminomutase [Sulfolobales archaeon HS-7]